MIHRSSKKLAALSAAAILSVGLVPSIAISQRAESPNISAPNRVIAIGRLIQSGRARNGTTRYALLDDEGALTGYVVPSAGVDVQSHLNDSVAITAERVSRDPDGLPYLLAQHIAPVSHGASNRDPAERRRIDEPRIVNEVVPYDEFDVLTDDGFETQMEAASRTHDLTWASSMHRGVRRRDVGVRRAARFVAEDSIVRPAEELPPLVDSQRPNTFSRATEGCGNGDCSSCAPCGPCTDSCCPCGPAGRFWFRADYLGWWSKDASAPALVTTSPAGTSAQDAGVLGAEGTRVIVGDGDADTVSRSGVRFVLGGWLDRCKLRGLELDYYFLDSETESNGHSSFGDPILARPFFNTDLEMQDSELVAYPGIVSGSVGVVYESEFQSFAPRYRHNLNCRSLFPPPCGGCGGCDGCESISCGPIGGSRVDLTLGLRYLRLNESLLISEDLISETDTSFATFNLFDSFETTNEFSGFEMGLVWDVYRRRWSMEVATRFAMGNNKRKVSINGGTTTVTQGAAFNDVGGLLALPSNIGTYEDDEFVVIPELSLMLGYQIAPRVRFLVGYTVVYWNNVVRPGDQIDLNVNPNLLPPAVDTNGLLAPKFAMNDQNFWAQGINLGLDWRW